MNSYFLPDINVLPCARVNALFFSSEQLEAEYPCLFPQYSRIMRGVGHMNHVALRRRVFVFSLADDDNLNVSVVTAGGPKKDRFCPGPFRAPHSFSLYRFSLE